MVIISGLAEQTILNKEGKPMDLTFFVEVAGLAAIGVVVVQQVLKLKIIPLAFANRYPVLTNILLSIVASVVAVTQAGLVKATSWVDWLMLVVTVSVTAAIIYNQLLKNWTQLRATEGEK